MDEIEPAASTEAFDRIFALRTCYPDCPEYGAVVRVTLSHEVRHSAKLGCNAHVGKQVVIPLGFSDLVATIDGMDLPVLAYRPSQQVTGLWYVFHGNGRNAISYRNSAAALAAKTGLIVLAPLFDGQRFPSSAYHRGGIVSASGRILPGSQWTTRLAPALIRWGQEMAETALPCWLWGHSAGAQFLCRVAAYQFTDVRRIVLSSPSTFVLPSVGADGTAADRVPFGFAGLDQQFAWGRLKEYLEAPLTLCLATSDDDPDDPLLSRGPEADWQGPSRLARGLRVFALAKAAAGIGGWRFGWRLVMAPNIAHSADGMLRARATFDALFPKDP